MNIINSSNKDLFNINHLDEKLKEKLGLFCNVQTNYVFESPDVETIYEIPLVLHKQNFDQLIIDKLNIDIKSKHKNINYLDF